MTLNDTMQHYTTVYKTIHYCQHYIRLYGTIQHYTTLYKTIRSAIMRNKGISIVQGQFVKRSAHAVSRSVMALWRSLSLKMIQNDQVGNPVV